MSVDLSRGCLVDLSGDVRQSSVRGRVEDFTVKRAGPGGGIGEPSLY